MPVTIISTDNGNGLVYKVKGVIQGSEFIKAEENFFANASNWTALKYAIIDYSEATEVNFSVKEIEILSEICKKKAEHYPRGLIAIYTNQIFVKTLTEIWGLFIKDLEWEYAIFTDMTNLERWLSSKLDSDYTGFFITKPFIMKGDTLQHHLEHWRKVLYLLADYCHVSTALIMKFYNGILEVVQTNPLPHDAPYQIGYKEKLAGSGSYFEHIMNADQELYVYHVEREDQWYNNPSITHKFISCFGMPVHDPTGNIFGIMCLLNEKPIHITDNFKDLVKSVCNILESQIELSTNNKKLSRYLKEIVDLHIFLNNESKTDFLTRLYNRKNFFEVCEREFNRSIRNKTHVSFIFCDIDYFKKVNDTFGHDAGDLVLKHVASLLKSHLRNYDIVWRWGGEEFLIMLPETDLRNATTVAKKLRSIIDDSTVSYQNKKIHVTMSFGVAETFKHERIDRLLMRLDKHLYEAKKQGRNTVVSH